MFKNISLYSKLALLLTAMVTILALGCSSSSDSSSPSAPAQPQAPAAAAAAEAAAPAAKALSPKPAAKGFADVAATAAAEPSTPTSAVQLPPDRKYGGNLNYAMGSNNNHVFYQQYTPGAGAAWAMTIGDPIMAYGAGAEWLKEKSMATSFEVSEDGKTLVFQLREGTNYSDGTPFNAESQAWSLNWVLDPENTAVTRPQISAIESVTATGEYEVTIVTERVYTPILAALGMMGGMSFSPTAYEADGVDHFKTFGAPTTGPFMVDEWIQGSQTKFSANPHYHTEGKPYLDSWTWVEIDDFQVRGAALQTGQVDLIQSHAKALDTNLALRADSNLTELKSFAGVRLSHHNAAREPFDDLRVRQAAQHAMDRQGWNDVIANGEGHTYMGSVIPPASAFAYEVAPGEFPYDYDPAAGKALLEEYAADKGLTLPLTTMSAYTCTPEQSEAGCVDLVEQPIGVTTTSKSEDVARAEFELELYKAVGFEPTMNIGEGREGPRTFVDKSASFSLRGFGVRPHPSGSFDSYMGYGGYWNNGGWSQAPIQMELDQLLKDAAATYDYDEQVKLYKEAQKVYMENCLGGVKSANLPTLWYVSPSVGWPGAPSVDHVLFHSDGSLKVYDMWME